MPNTKQPWNEWRGLHEGDMLEEMVEFDHNVYGVPVDESRAELVTYTSEEIRRAWWYAIGRHNYEV